MGCGKSVSATKIAHSLFPDPEGIKRRPKKYIGRDLHKKLQYGNQEHFKKKYGEWRVHGTPDRYNGSVIEFKTYFPVDWFDFRELQFSRGIVQLLVCGYASGNPNLELHMYNLEENVRENPISFSYKHQDFIELMEAYKVYSETKERPNYRPPSIA
jgi:hypothetical protein